MGNFVTFRMTTGKKLGTVSFKGGTANKDGSLKFINYWPGGSSIFDEDNKDSAIKPKSVVFKYNDILSDPALEIIVRKSDKQLLDYLMAHPAYNRKYAIHDENEIAKKEVAGYESISKAMAYVNKASDIETHAMAVCILGHSYHGKTIEKCKADLSKRAIESPDGVIKIVEAKGFESLYMASTAFITGLVKSNQTHTAVIWNDGTDGVILHIAKGENGIEKLGQLISEPGEQGRLLLQEIGNRLDGKKGKKISLKEVSEKDKYIAELEAKLAAKGAIDKPELKEAPKTSEYDELEIEELQDIYVKRFKKKLSFAYKNDREWIKAKLTA